MTDELRPDPAEMNGKTADAQTAGTAAVPPAEPDRTMVMNTDSVDRTLVMDCDSPDRTIVLSPENGITRANPDDTQAIGGKQRTRIHTLLHTPTSILSALTGTGTGKRDVGAKIDGMDRHRERAEVGHMDETQALLGISQRGQKLPRPLQARLHRVPLFIIQIRDRFLFRHRSFHS